MTTYNTVTGAWSNGATVSLPTGSDGDTMIFVAYASANPGAFSGWSLNGTFTTTAWRFRVYSKTRAGGETTVVLPTVTGSGGKQYSILNVPSTFAYFDAAVTDLNASSWSFSDSWPRQAPKFALGILNCGDTGLSISGDFVQDSTYNDAVNNRDGFAYVADLTSGNIDVTASGVWDAAGAAAWLIVFFSDIESATRHWYLGVAGFGPGGVGTG